MSNDQLTQWLIDEVRGMRTDLTTLQKEMACIRARRTMYTGLVSVIVSGTITVLASLFASKV